MWKHSVKVLSFIDVNICCCRFRCNEAGYKDAVVVSSVAVSQNQCYFEIGMTSSVNFLLCLLL